MISHEIGPLTVHIRFPGHKHFDKLMPEQTDNILHSLFVNLNKLLSVFWQPIYKKYKYIDSMPAGPYKSVQMVLARLEELCGKEYIDQAVASMKKLRS